MGIKDFMEKVNRRQKEKKEILKAMEQDVRFQKIVEERQKSANERELNRYINEEKEEQIKNALEYMRKKRQHDIAFGHNPLNVKNITNSTDWEVLKEKNMFNKNKNMFANQPYIHNTNTKLLNSGNVLHGKNLFKKKGRNILWQ